MPDWFPENKMFGWGLVQGPKIWIIQSNEALITSEAYPDKMTLAQSDDHCHLMIILRYNDSDFSFNWWSELSVIRVALIALFFKSVWKWSCFFPAGVSACSS